MSESNLASSISPPRRRREPSPDSSISPPRRRRVESPTISPPRKRRSPSNSPPRRQRRSSPSNSPPRRQKAGSPSNSPPRRSRQRSPSSPRRYRPSPPRRREPNSQPSGDRQGGRDGPRRDDRRGNKQDDTRRKKKRFAYDREEEEDDSKYEYGKPSTEAPPEEKEDEEKKKKVKPNFHLSGKLSEEARTTVTGVVLKFSEPADAQKPVDKWRLYPFKGDQPLDPIQLQKQSAFLFGRDRSVCDVILDHLSCSKQHAAIQFREIEKEDPDTLERFKVIKPYIIDLESTNGTMLNKEKIQTSRYIEIKEKDIINFGFSSRDYVVIREDA